MAEGRSIEHSPEVVVCLAFLRLHSRERLPSSVINNNEEYRSECFSVTVFDSRFGC